jgi:hypothetical protein
VLTRCGGGGRGGRGWRASREGRGARLLQGTPRWLAVPRSGSRPGPRTPRQPPTGRPLSPLRLRFPSPPRNRRRRRWGPWTRLVPCPASWTGSSFPPSTVLFCLILDGPGQVTVTLRSCLVKFFRCVRLYSDQIRGD